MTVSTELDVVGTRAALRACPTCRRAEGSLTRIGPSIFSTWDESLRANDLRNASGDLYRCHTCHLIYRWPIPSPEQLRAAYDETPVNSWKYAPPPHWQWTTDTIAKLAPNKNILDVGCFRGDFLASLPNTFNRFGIEPNRRAAHIAATRNIQILGEDAAADYSHHRGTFGAITLMDVIEHVPDPLQTLARLQPLLAKGGVFIIITGNADYWLAKKSLPFYYYTSFPSHLVFLSLTYMRRIADKLNMKIRASKTMPHEKVTTKTRIADTAKARIIMWWHCHLKNSPLAGALKKIPPFKRVANILAPPHYRGLKDHMWIVLQT